ncbi:MAG: hypothetical protein IAA85_00980 [Firmicutes bacterium]|nr:hypothetical protein [Candidatus Alectryobacillus merdavium]
MKRLYLLILLLLCNLFLFTNIVGANVYYVGSVNSDIYHYPNCRAARRINDNNLVSFDSVKEALDAGYKPCSICKPPTKYQDNVNEISEQMKEEKNQKLDVNKFKELTYEKTKVEQHETSLIYELTGYRISDIQIIICEILKIIMFLSVVCIIILSIKRLLKR